MMTYKVKWSLVLVEIDAVSLPPSLVPFLYRLLSLSPSLSLTHSLGITCNLTVCLITFSGWQQWRHQTLHHWTFVRGIPWWLCPYHNVMIPPDYPSPYHLDQRWDERKWQLIVPNTTRYDKQHPNQYKHTSDATNHTTKCDGLGLTLTQLGHSTNAVLFSDVFSTKYVMF